MTQGQWQQNQYEDTAEVPYQQTFPHKIKQKQLDYYKINGLFPRPVNLRLKQNKHGHGYICLLIHITSIRAAQVAVR